MNFSSILWVVVVAAAAVDIDLIDHPLIVFVDIKMMTDIVLEKQNKNDFFKFKKKQQTTNLVYILYMFFHHHHPHNYGDDGGGVDVDDYQPFD